MIRLFIFSVLLCLSIGVIDAQPRPIVPNRTKTPKTTIKKPIASKPKRAPVLTVKKPVSPLNYIPFCIIGFGNKSTQLSSIEEMNIYNLAEYLKWNPTEKITITGYANCNKGDIQSDNKTARLRVRAVYDPLVNIYGINPERLTIQYADQSQAPYDKIEWNNIVVIETTSIPEFPLYVITFPNNSSTLNAIQELKIFNMAEWLKAIPTNTIIIVGYTTKDIGTIEQNITLCERRGNAVGDALIRNYGISPNRLTVKYDGSDVMPYPNREWNNSIFFTQK